MGYTALHPTGKGTDIQASFPEDMGTWDRLPGNVSTFGQAVLDLAAEMELFGFWVRLICLGKFLTGKCGKPGALEVAGP